MLLNTAASKKKSYRDKELNKTCFIVNFIYGHELEVKKRIFGIYG
jgi:hypothetical protein